MNPDRLVEIWWQHDGQDGYGTGYLISDRHILTCDHVIRPNGIDPKSVPVFQFAQYVPDTGWRRIIGRKPQLKPLQATFAWCDQDVDAALLTATQPVKLSPPHPVLGPVAVAAGDLRYPFDAAGFPRASVTAEVGEICHLSGSISTLEGVRTGKMMIYVKEGGPPVKPEHWKGISGGPIFAENAGPSASRQKTLVGIITSYSEEFGGQKMSGMSMEVVRERPGFSAIAPAIAAGMQPPPARPAAPSDASASDVAFDMSGLMGPLCTLDREDHVRKFRANVVKAAKDPITKPVALFWGGHEHHRHDLLIQRLEKFEIAPALSRIPRVRNYANTDRFEDARWPECVDDIDGLWMIITDQLVNILGTESAEPEEIRDVLNQGIKPRSFYCAINSDAYDDMQEQLLRRFVEFWDEVSCSEKIFGDKGKKNTHVPVTLLFYFFGSSEEKARKDADEAYAWTAGAAKNLQVDNLPAFNLVTMDHINRWLDGPVRINAPTLANSIDQVKDYFEEWIKERKLTLDEIYKEIAAITRRKRKLGES